MVQDLLVDQGAVGEEVLQGVATRPIGLSPLLGLGEEALHVGLVEGTELLRTQQRKKLLGFFLRELLGLCWDWYYRGRGETGHCLLTLSCSLP